MDNDERFEKLKARRQKLKERLADMDDEFLKYGPVKQLEEVEQEIKEVKDED